MNFNTLSLNGDFFLCMYTMLSLYKTQHNTGITVNYPIGCCINGYSTIAASERIHIMRWRCVSGGCDG